MKTLALQPILANLTEAHGELARLFARLQFIVFGEVVDESVKEWAETVAQDERTTPLDILCYRISNALGDNAVKVSPSLQKAKCFSPPQDLVESTASTEPTHERTRQILR